MVPYDGDRNGFVRLLYTRVFYPNGGGDYETSKGLQNEILGLPEEDLDEATREAIRLALNGELSAGDRKDDASIYTENPWSSNLLQIWFEP